MNRGRETESASNWKYVAIGLVVGALLTIADGVYSRRYCPVVDTAPVPVQREAVIWV